MLSSRAFLAGGGDVTAGGGAAGAAGGGAGTLAGAAAGGGGTYAGAAAAGGGGGGGAAVAAGAEYAAVGGGGGGTSAVLPYVDAPPADVTDPLRLLLLTFFNVFSLEVPHTQAMGNTRNTRGEIHVVNIVRAEKGACIEVKQLSKCPPAHHHHPTDTENACL
jgi:hypothetical protein